MHERFPEGLEGQIIEVVLGNGRLTLAQVRPYLGPMFPTLLLSSILHHLLCDCNGLWRPVGIFRGSSKRPGLSYFRQSQ